jgi:hypothetical protein
MKNKFFLVFAFTLIFIGIYSIGASKAVACECPQRVICQAYSRAKAVFIGTVQKIEYINYSQKITFSVEKTFKGKTGKIETANFFEGDCGNSFKIGEKYFVYKEAQAEPCNRTFLLSASRYDLEYAESLSENNPVFNINGILENLSEVEAKSAKITIEKGQKTFEPDFDEYGNFSFKASENGIYRIKIVLPFRAQISLSRFKENTILPKNAKLSLTAQQTVLEYDVEFKPNECDFRWFLVYK